MFFIEYSFAMRPNTQRVFILNFIYLQFQEIFFPIHSTSTGIEYTANVNRQTADKLLFSYAIITGENV